MKSTVRLQTLHPAATFLCVAKLKLLLPCSMLLLLLLQLLSWWAVSATAVPVARMQRHRQNEKFTLLRSL